MKKKKRFLLAKGSQHVGRKLMEEPKSTEPAGREEPMPKLSKAQKERKKLLELDVNLYNSAFENAGLALAEIRIGKLHLDEYPTFEGYCWAKWGFTSRRARQLISAALDMTNMRKAAKGRDIRLPENEGQVRAMGGLETSVQLDVVMEALEITSGGRPPASLLKKLGKEHQFPRLGRREVLININPALGKSEVRKNRIPLPGMRGGLMNLKSVVVKSGDKGFEKILEILPFEYRHVSEIRLTPISKSQKRVSTYQMSLGL